MNCLNDRQYAALYDPEIVVVHEVTLAAAVTNLKRIILACGDRKVIIITPGPRYLSQPCCCTAGHCIHLLVPESGLKMMADLARLHLFIQRRLSSSSNCQVIPACDLLAGKKGASLEEALAAFSTWGTVHGSTASYTRMALALVDGHFGNTLPAAPVLPAPPPQHQKRQRAESSTSYESGSEAGHPIPALTSFRTSSRPPPTHSASRGAALADPDPVTSSRAAPREATSMAAAAPAAAAPAAAESEPDGLRHFLLATSKYLMCSVLHFVLYFLFFP